MGKRIIINPKAVSEFARVQTVHPIRVTNWKYHANCKQNPRFPKQEGRNLFRASG